MIVGVLRGNGELLANSLHGGTVDVVGTIGQAPELDGEFHDVAWVVQIGNDADAGEAFLRFVDDQGHGIVGFYVVLDDQLHSVGSVGNWFYRNVSLGVSDLDCIFVGPNISLGQDLHLIGVLLELFLLLFDNALAQSTASTGGILSGRGRVQRCFHWLPVGAQANLEAFLLPFLPLKADRHPLKPGVLLELFFVLRGRLFQIGNPLPEIGILSREPWPNQGQHYRETNKRAATGRILRI